MCFHINILHFTPQKGNFTNKKQNFGQKIEIKN